MFIPPFAGLVRTESELGFPIIVSCIDYHCIIMEALYDFRYAYISDLDPYVIH